MFEKMVALREEISPGGSQDPRAGTSNHGCKVGLARREVGAAHSSATPSSPSARRTEGGNDAAVKGPYLIDGNSEVEDEAMALFAGIATPPKVRQLQRTLYRKAKADRRWRAWSLYGDLCRRDVLETALAAVVRKAGVRPAWTGSEPRW